MENNYDIFISYSRKNLEQVKKFKEEIESSTNAFCWMDFEGIESGTPKFTKAIIHAINACPIFLFMLSEESQKSENAIKELDFAYKKYREEGKKVVIVYIVKCKMTDEFSFDYGKADTIDWLDSIQHDKLIRDIKKWIENRPGDSPVSKNNSIYIDMLNKLTSKQITTQAFQFDILFEKSSDERLTIDERKRAIMDSAKTIGEIVQLYRDTRLLYPKSVRTALDDKLNQCDEKAEDGLLKLIVFVQSFNEVVSKLSEN